MPFYALLPNQLTQPTIKRLVIGDTIVDVSFAKALNCDAGWVAYGYGKWNDVNHLPIHHKWQSIQEAHKDLNE